MCAAIGGTLRRPGPSSSLSGPGARCCQPGRGVGGARPHAAAHPAVHEHGGAARPSRRTCAAPACRHATSAAHHHHHHYRRNSSTALRAQPADKHQQQPTPPNQKLNVVNIISALSSVSSVYDKYDKDKSRQLSLDEVVALLNGPELTTSMRTLTNVTVAHRSKADVEPFFKRADADRSGGLGRTEFMALYLALAADRVKHDPLVSCNRGGGAARRAAIAWLCAPAACCWRPCGECVFGGGTVGAEGGGHVQHTCCARLCALPANCACHCLRTSVLCVLGVHAHDHAPAGLPAPACGMVAVR